MPVRGLRVVVDIESPSAVIDLLLEAGRQVLVVHGRSCSQHRPAPPPPYNSWRSSRSSRARRVNEEVEKKRAHMEAKSD